MIKEVEAKLQVNAFEFSDDLFDEALDRAPLEVGLCGGPYT